MINMAMLTFPSSDLDLDSNSIIISEFLIDPKRRVRQAALESVALLASCLGNQRIQLLYDFIAHLEKKEKTFGEILSAVKTRIARKQLPKLTTDGLVEYGLTISPHLEMDFAKNQGRGLDDPDILWILQGSGPLTRGSTGNSGDSHNNHSLGFPNVSKETRYALTNKYLFA